MPASVFLVVLIIVNRIDRRRERAGVEVVLSTTTNC